MIGKDDIVLPRLDDAGPQVPGSPYQLVPDRGIIRLGHGLDLERGSMDSESDIAEQVIIAGGPGWK